MSWSRQQGLTLWLASPLDNAPSESHVADASRAFTDVNIFASLTTPEASTGGDRKIAFATPQPLRLSFERRRR